MPTQNVSLSEHYKRFVEERVQSGRYESASEVFRAGLRLLEDQESESEEKLKLLRQAAQVGIQDLEDGRSVSIPPSGIDDFLMTRADKIQQSS